MTDLPRRSALSFTLPCGYPQIRQSCKCFKFLYINYTTFFSFFQDQFEIFPTFLLKNELLLVFGEKTVTKLSFLKNFL